MGHTGGDGGAGFRRKWQSMSTEERQALLSRSFHSRESRQKAGASVRMWWRSLTPEAREAQVRAAADGTRRVNAKRRHSEGMRRYWAKKSVEERRQHYLNSFGSEEAKKKVARAMQKVWDDYSEEEKAARINRTLNSEVSKESWKRTWEAKSEEEKKEWVKVHLRGRKQPSEPEILLGSYLDEYFPGEWIYNGDRFESGIVIGGKIPDFVNVNGRKSVIEVFGDYWHDESEVEPLKAHYGRFGFDCVIIWEHECYVVEGIDSILGVLVDG